MGCGTGIIKYFVFLANLIFALAGLALVIIGVMFKLNVNDVQHILPSDFGLAPVLSITIGAIVFITAFLGCCGAVKESPCMLTTYAIVLLTIFIVQVAIGVYAFLQIKDTNSFRSAIHDNVQRTFDKMTVNPGANETMHLTQKWLHCCGVDGPEDYNGPKPSSCCANSNNGCPSVNNPVYSEGCAQRLFEYLHSKSKIIGGVAIGIAAAEILGAVFGLCLSSSINNQYRRARY